MCYYLMAGLHGNVTTLPAVGKLLSLCLFSPVLLLDGPLFSLSSPSPALIKNHRPRCWWLYTDDKMKTLRNPPALVHRPLEIMRIDAVISKLLRKQCFSDVIYLVLCQHPVMMTCHSSLFCALYLYIWSGFFFTVFLWIYHPFFVPYLQLMKK